MVYLLKVSALIAIFYVCYKLFLQRDTFFEANRWFLMLGLFASFVLPFIVIPIYIEYTPITVSGFPINDITPPAPTEKTFNPLDYIPFVYGLGVAFFTVRFLIQLTSLAKLILKDKGRKEGSFTFIETNDDTPPFSFFNWIVYNPNQFNLQELNQIIAHEKTHAKQYHSIDILLAQICCILLWFNPFIWLYNKDLKQNLEFIADRNTLNAYDCKKSYQYTLLKTSMPSHQMALGNAFYNSLIKKRIIMLHKSKSRKRNQLKYLLVVPALLIFLISCNSKEIETESLDASEPLILSVEKSKQPLIVLDGEKITQEAFKNLDENSIYSMTVWKTEKGTEKYGDEGKNGVIEIITKSELGTNFKVGMPLNDIKITGYASKPGSTPSKYKIKAISTAEGKTPLIIVDGKEFPNEELEALDTNSFESTNVLKGETAIQKYGEEGKNGVIEITTKK